MLAPPPEPSSRPLLAVGAAGLAAAGVIAWLAQRGWRSSGNPRHDAAKACGAGAAILCLSVALDSATEHYRARFRNRVMIAGPSMALLGLGAAAYTLRRPHGANASPVRMAFAVVGLAGFVGAGFHAYNIVKRPGALSANNLFYGAPAGAPAALTLSGLYGVIAGELLSDSAYAAERLPRDLALLVAGSLAGTAAEAGLLHFRGAFQNPAMYAPVTIPPLAALAIGATVAWPQAARIAEPLLKATAVLGIAGPMFHAYGIHRNMGGWRNWSQMILQGPPLPAPPAFLGIAVVGLGLLPLLDGRGE